MAIERVAKRVSEGGHNIPTDTITRRYWLGLQNFFYIFTPIVDSWMFFENLNQPNLLADDVAIIYFPKLKNHVRTRKKGLAG